MATRPAQSDPRADRLEILYDLTSAMAHASGAEHIYDAALDALLRGTHCDRAAILLFDSDGVMRFTASRGLSQAYRRAVEGHTPWTPDSADAQPIIVPDVTCDAGLSAHRDAICAEGIRGLAFIPLLARSRVIGKFMLYTNAAHAFRQDDLRLAETIARHVAFAIERQRSHQRLVDAEARFRTLANAAPALIWHDDAEGNCQFVNQQYLDFFGKRLEDVQGRGWQPLLHPDDSGEYLADWRDAVANRRPFQHRTRVRRHDGQWRWLEGHALPLFSESGEFLGHVGVGPDITEMVVSERRKDEFLAMLAHELRNPLAAIRSGIEVLDITLGADPEVDRVRDTLTRQVRQLSRLVDDLLDISRITQGKMHLQTRRLNLAAAAGDAVDATRPMFKAAGHTLTVTVPPDEVIVEGDAARLVQVLSNLLNNAAKFMRAGGHVTLTIEREGSEAVMRVRDTGIGISAEQLPRIFEMFSQAAPIETRTEGGLGIGLSLARGLVDLHGGRIEARSGGLGRGSEFIVHLPLARGAAAVSAPETLPRAHVPERVHGADATRVLIVDDNADNADMLEMMLTLMGHHTRCARDGPEALRIAATYRPRVILLDIGLPGMNGYEVAQQIRQQPWADAVILIAVTGWGQAEDKRRAIEAGCDLHLTKPVDRQVLARLFADLPKHFSERG